MEANKPHHTPEQERAPVFRQWRSWYLLLIIVLVVQVIIYAMLSEIYS